MFPATVTWQDILDTLKGVDPLVHDISFVDPYTGKGIPDGHQSITLRVTIRDEDRTLEGAEIEALTAQIAERLGRELSESVRS